MGRLLDPVLDIFDGLLGWLEVSLGQLTESYCHIETAADENILIAKDGSFVSVIRCRGTKTLSGPEEFTRTQQGVTRSLQTSLSRSGHALQVFFQHDKEPIVEILNKILAPAKASAERLKLDLDDLFKERVDFLKNYCADEEMFFVLWTRPSALTKEQAKISAQNKVETLKKMKVKNFPNAQNIMAAIPELRDMHNTFVKVTMADFEELGLALELLDVHTACHHIRKTIDPDFTDDNWQPYLPGDKIPVRESKFFAGDISDILWPPLNKQLIPRDAENLNLRTCRIGDKIYGSVFVDLFSKELVPFVKLLRRTQHTSVPWRISFFLESEGMRALGLKPMLSTILSFASNNNKLINKSVALLNYIRNNTDEAIIQLKVTATTWAPLDQEKLLRTRVAELAKAIQGWGYTETSEVCGDAFAGILSSALAITPNNVARAAVAPLSDVTYMFPLTRPASLWNDGAVLFRSPDGKPWPYQPGSTLQTTWIDLVYARPGSGKSVLSNSINLALCLSGGLQRLPRVAIIDIGPSSSGLISLIQEALPADQKHLAAYHRLHMSDEMSINPFDTQLGCRYPSPQDRAFLVNFLTLLATPIGDTKPYDGIPDMAGLIIDELYKNLVDDANPNPYTPGLNKVVDTKLEELNFVTDSRTSWWEVTDAIFKSGDPHIAGIAQRYAMPLLADAASICRSKAVEDLYGSIVAPTGESIINAFGRMISAAVREYPILSKITAFDLGESKIVSLDLDEVAKTGGAAADRQTAIMYMLARYILARHYYLTDSILAKMPELYKDHHTTRIQEIREDPKRIVFDEFHRTSRAQAVRDQVLVDMREGRKWKVQVALLSQSLEDFDPVMVEFATGIFIMDAGPKKAVEKSAEVFGLSDTAKLALETKVHGPRADGATFLAVFSTKFGTSTQLITSTIGPIELWAFNTTAEDTRIRNALYQKIGAATARKVLATLYPSGSAAKHIEERLISFKDDKELISKEEANSIIDQLIEEILDAYHKDPRFAS